MPTHACVILLALTLTGARAVAQTQPARPPHPGERGSGPPIAPARPAAPDLGQPSVPDPVLELPATTLPADYQLPRAKTYPEATVLTGLKGTAVTASTGDLVFVPDAPRDDSAGRPTPPMVLMPCQRLAQLTSALATREQGAKITIGGQVYAYRNRMHLLPTSFAIDAPGATETPAPEADDPAVAALIKELEAGAAAPRAISPALESPVAEPAEPGQETTLPAEDTLLSHRRGRLVRLPHDSGRFSFTFDNDPDSPAMEPLLILPCKSLEKLEQMAGARGDGLTFVMTGRVMTFRERSYLLPLFFQVVRPGDLTPGQ